MFKNQMSTKSLNLQRQVVLSKKVLKSKITFGGYPFVLANFGVLIRLSTRLSIMLLIWLLITYLIVLIIG
jgi:hypothetical protein